MDDFFDSFLNYLETTPDEELFNEWSKYEEFDKVGPRIEDFISSSLQFGFTLTAENIKQTVNTKFNQYNPKFSSGFFI